MATTFENPGALLEAVGQDLGHSSWLAIDQDRINLFAEATGDHQWIHVDPVAAANGPFGAPIAHGYLTMSLSNLFLPEILEVQNVSMGINYGVNKVRFLNPVLVGSNVRASGELIEATEVPGGVQAIVKITIEIDGVDKPAAVIESVSRFMS